MNIINYKRRLISWWFRTKYSRNNFKSSNKLILFFVPAEVHNITGGALSICTIFKEVKNLKEIHKSNVVASYLPIVNSPDYRFTKFKNEMVIFNFRQITKKFKTLKFLEIHIPDYMIPLFKKNNTQFDLLYSWLYNVKEFKINILNQNDLLMPDLVHVNDLKKITSNLTMTVAHEKYATKERRDFYKIPLHLLSPWLSPSPYLVKNYNQKENLIVISPDDIDRVPSSTKLTKQQILNKIEELLPDYKIIIIQDMSYEEYKDIISRSKFMITFGEGLDGYFIESIFSGSISFAVYNEYFFKPNFKNLPTVYKSFDNLFEFIVADIKKYDEAVLYKNYNEQLNQIVSRIYSYKRLQDNVKDYYLGNIDFK
jgi:hypothetical protein